MEEKNPIRRLMAFLFFSWRSDGFYKLNTWCGSMLILLMMMFAAEFGRWFSQILFYVTCVVLERFEGKIQSERESWMIKMFSFCSTFD